MPLVSNPTYARARTDVSTLVTTALPAQNTNVTGASLDLNNLVANIGRSLGFADLRISVPATPNLANGQTLTLQLEDSADNISFAPIASEPATVITGAGGAGGPATLAVYQLNDVQRVNSAIVPRRYLALNVAASATAGNNTGVSSSMQFYI